MPFEVGLMDSRQAPSSQVGGHLPLSDTPHTEISPVDPGLAAAGPDHDTARGPGGPCSVAAGRMAATRGTGERGTAVTTPASDEEASQLQ